MQSAGRGIFDNDVVIIVSRTLRQILCNGDWPWTSVI